MTFSEYALGLYPYISYGRQEPDFFTELIGNFIEDASMDACQILKKADDTKYRYVKGDRTITKKDAQYIYDHRDKNKFNKWLWNRMDDSESYDSIEKWLGDFAYDYDDVADACADLLEEILLNIISGSASQSQQSLKNDIDLITDLESKIKLLSRPMNVPVPEAATQNEQTYINETCLAYGDAEGIDNFSKDDLVDYPEYAADLEERRIDFYSAESIRRSVLELKSEHLTDQFDVLKDETFNGIKDTAKRIHPNGFEHMLAVMEQAVVAPVTNYLFSSSPYWISAKIKKGVCHHLVNDGKLRWVRRKQRK